MKMNLVVVAIMLSLSGIGASHALELGSEEETDADINGEIILRCQYQLGEFGIAAVNTCIESEHNARKALSSYPEETADIVWRCIGSRYDVGWEMIKICADNDIAADVALRAYAPEHGDIIKACRDKIGQYRHAEVKQCVDGLLAEQRGVPK
jgi:hypothetical protein